MGFLDKLKGTMNQAKAKATEVAEERGPQIKEGIGKAGAFVDKKTKGKYSGQIHKGEEQAEKAVDQLHDEGGSAASAVEEHAEAAEHRVQDAAEEHLGEHLEDDAPPPPPS